MRSTSYSREIGRFALPRQTAKRASDWPLLTLLALVAVLAVGGLSLATSMVARGQAFARPAAPRSDSYGLGQDIPTSFGIVSVEYVQQLNGLSGEDLGGMTHGIQNYVPPDKVQLQVSIGLTNLLNTTVDYSPAQFQLTVGRGGPPIAPAGATFPAGRLQPNAGIDGRLRFVVPRDSADLWIEFREPGRAQPILIALGTIEPSPGGASTGTNEEDGHEHR